MRNRARATGLAWYAGVHMGDDKLHLRRSLVAAAGTSVFLSVLFLVVYGGCNWIASQRSDVGSWFFEWERHIPFVPAMILPYMSIDLFFVAAPFLCRDAGQRRTFARRIVFAIVVAGAFFLVMPLRFAFERPRAEGWLGAIFDRFREMDQPYNLFPSLHITLRTILANLYVQYTRGLVQGAVHIWFSLIGLSTLLTYQHHVMDVVGGFVLAGVCFYVVRETSPRLAVVKNLWVGCLYGAAAVAALALALWTWPWGALLLWPGLVASIMTAAYCGLGPGVFRKKAGRLPLSTCFVLAPLLVGQHLSLLYYRRQSRPWDEAAPGVWIGRRLNDAEAAEAVRQGVTAVLDLTVELSEAKPFLAVTYRNLPVLDLTAPTLEQMREAAAFIAEHAPARTVYVHCKAGYSRSAAAVGAYLLASGRASTVADAMNLLRKARPRIIIRPEAIEALGNVATKMRCAPDP